MRIILDEEEGWSLLLLVVAQVLDQVELSEDTRTALKEWRYGLKEGTDEMLAFTTAMNGALGNKIDEELSRMIRRRDYYRRA